MSEFIFWLSCLTIMYIYGGYFLLLRFVGQFVHKKNIIAKESTCPDVSVILCVYDGENSVKARIDNLLHGGYPVQNMEIIVASDGSTDNTVKIAKQFDSVKVLDFKRNRGRAMSQNDGMNQASGEFVVFSDVDTVFDKNFICEIVNCFSDDKVGCVVGNLTYKTEGTAISESEGFYWKFEKKLRALESQVGILATATGACMAIRKELWRELTPIDDSDFTTPLDVVLQGYSVVYAPDAIAYDMPTSSVKGEMKTKIRQTSKNLVGTLKRWGWVNCFKHPVLSWGLLSHKILRWFTPFFMIGAFVSNLLLLDSRFLYQASMVGQAMFYFAAIIGLAGEIFEKKISFASTVFSFCVANLGMGIGVVRGAVGKAPAAYKMTE